MDGHAPVTSSPTKYLMGLILIVLPKFPVVKLLHYTVSVYTLNIHN